MIKKRLLFSILFLFLVNIVCAEYTEEIYYDWLNSGDNFSVDGYGFEIGINQPQNKISVEIEGLGGLVLYNNSCSDIGNYSICLENIVVDYHNYTTDKFVYKANVRVYQYLAFLTTTKEPTKTDLLIGETSRVNTIINNVGSVTADNVIYEEKFEDFTISEVSGCSSLGNIISWKGSLRQGASQKCSFSITATKAKSQQLSTAISYFNGREFKSVSTDAITITVSDYSSNVNSSISKNRIEIGENTTLNITLRNIHGTYSMLIYKFTIDVPFGLNILKKSSTLNLLNNKYTWMGNLLAGESTNFFLILQGESQGNYSIKEHIDYMIDNLRNELNFSEDFNVYLEKPEIVFQMNNQLNPGDKTHIKIYVRNPSSKYIFKDLDVEFNTDLPDSQSIKKTIINLQKNAYNTIFETDFIAPKVDKETKFFLNVKLSYKSIYNQYLKSEEKSSIRIIPESVETEKAINETPMEESEAVETIVSSQTVNQTIQEKEVVKETPILLSTREEIIDKIQLSKDSLKSLLFILIDLVTVTLIILAFIKLK